MRLRPTLENLPSSTFFQQQKILVFFTTIFVSYTKLIQAFPMQVLYFYYVTFDSKTNQKIWLKKGAHGQPLASYNRFTS